MTLAAKWFRGTRATGIQEAVAAAMILSFHPCITADHQIILGSRSPNRSDALMAARADAVCEWLEENGRDSARIGLV